MGRLEPIAVLAADRAQHAYGHTLPYLRQLKEAGFEACLVGGGIRDLLLERSPGDWDIATSARPEDMLRLWPDAVPTGLQHGTITLLTPEPEGLEITSFRDDGPYTDGRHPDWVAFGASLEQDLARRDFTINAMAFDPLDAKFHDPFQGLNDLDACRIKAVGDPRRRFEEDGLRPLRGIRLAAVLGFRIEPATLTAMSEGAHRVSGVARERIREEMVKLLRAEHPSRGIELLRRTGLLEVVAPELLEGVDMPQNRHHAYDVYRHTLSTVDAAPPDNLRVRLAALLHDVGKPRTRTVVNGEGSFRDHQSVGAGMARDILGRLRFPKREAEAVAHLVQEHMFHYTQDWSDAAVRRFVRRVGREHLDDLFALRRADNVGNGLKPECPPALTELERRVDQVLGAADALAVGDLDITGEEVMQVLGIPPGPGVGEALEYLLQSVMEDPKKNHKPALVQLLHSFDRQLLHKDNQS